MRIAIVGATGNVGTALLRTLAAAGGHELVGVARRAPDPGAEPYRSASWHQVDIGSPDAVPALRTAFGGCDAVVHLAWIIQPNHHQDDLHRVNVEGSWQVFEAAAEAGVKHLVYASSVGAYSPGPKDERVDESWPTGGLHTSHYSRQKAAVERLLDRFEADHQDITVARLRPGLIFQSRQASEVGRYFLGRFIPQQIARSRVPVLPMPPTMVFQAVHAEDVADAYAKVLTARARGAFNVAAEPVLDPTTFPPVLGAKKSVPLPAAVLRALVWLSWKLRVQRTDPGWIDMAVQVPIMDTTRIRSALGWEPRRSSQEAVTAVLGGMQEASGVPASAALRPGDQAAEN
ncbi:NAD-dependent epimerase/dehydratase family protein [Sinomonas atrocyanea]|uniref:NAD-dependent epimerase/dehydratase family protein n=1 Tax=Sinomonas atrocyanea TaxID=37927 RepID=UPI0027802D21|nr:NAD-dependent epimerase/dehydratase family protein [Sinomonas atrocyanea]MDQ0258873.1 nucleoside-diphosphate-sugar epimerase [Sinomonas atrocyanea]MDR6621060.1 nucleoside-diphosphate-sugar epimerase [Sinomonas atrocyanea]